LLGPPVIRRLLNFGGHQKIIILLLLLFLFSNIVAQDTADKTISTQADSVLPVLRAQDGKIVTIGKPISLKPLTIMDKVKIFFEAVYAKYPVWCWIWAIIAVLPIGRFLTRIFSK
jgi:hypothetical protein